MISAPYPGAITPAPSSGGGASDIVAETEITTGNEAQILQVIDLDLDANPNGYKCVYMLNHNGSNASSNLFFTLNDDIVQTGYFTNGNANNSTFDTTTVNSAVRAGYFEIRKMTTGAGTEYPYIMYRLVGNDANSTGSTYVQISANVTKIAIRSSGMNFGNGSYLKCYAN